MSKHKQLGQKIKRLNPEYGSWSDESVGKAEVQRIRDSSDAYKSYSSDKLIAARLRELDEIVSVDATVNDSVEDSYVNDTLAHIRTIKGSSGIIGNYFDRKDTEEEVRKAGVRGQLRDELFQDVTTETAIRVALLERKHVPAQVEAQHKEHMAQHRAVEAMSNTEAIVYKLAGENGLLPIDYSEVQKQKELNAADVGKEKGILGARFEDYQQREGLALQNKPIYDQLELDKEYQSFWNRLRATLAIKHLEERQTILVMTDGLLELERKRDAIKKEDVSEETKTRMLERVDRQIKLLEDEIDVRHARSIKDPATREVGGAIESPGPQPVARRLGDGDSKQG